MMQNERMDIRMIALDLDGTLMGPDGHVSERNRAVLAQAAAAGVFVVPCSGRAMEMISPEILNLTGVRYAVTSGGGAAYDLLTGEELVYNTLPEEIAHEVTDLVLSHGCRIEFYGGRSVYSPEKQAPGCTAQEIHNWIAANAGSIVKLDLIFGEKTAPLAAIREALRERTDLLLSAASSRNLEVNAADGGKGDALRALGKKLGITTQQIMACGDHLNDLSMLRTVGLPVAMGNAVPEAKAVAAYVTKTNAEDGVAAAVERFVFDKV